jgi:tRNA(fMet)-specific endonuclease VapC
MSGVLIDTNIYSLAMRGDPQVVKKLQSISRIGFSVISVGELLSGFKGGSRETDNRRELSQFLDSPRVTLYPVDTSTADFYAEILDRLRRQGTPVPTNDLWIAASVFQQGLKIFSHDRHFEQIAGLVHLI